MLHVLTTLEVLDKGLMAVGYEQRQIDRVGMKKNISRFRTNYVSHPRIYADLFERLQRIGDLDCSVLGIDKTVNYFFAAMHLLAQYPTEEKAESAFSFDMCDRTFRDHSWDIVWKIFDLHHHIIAWPTWWGNPDDPNGPTCLLDTKEPGIFSFPSAWCSSFDQAKLLKDSNVSLLSNKVLDAPVSHS